MVGEEPASYLDYDESIQPCAKIPHGHMLLIYFLMKAYVHMSIQPYANISYGR